MTSIGVSTARPRRGLIAIAPIGLIVWSVIIGGYMLIAGPLRDSGAREVSLAREGLIGLLVAAAVAAGVAFLALLHSTVSGGRRPLLLALVCGFAVALGLIVVVNWVAVSIAPDSMAILGPTLSTVVPVGAAVVVMLLAAVSTDRKRAGMRLAFGLGIGLGLILLLLNVAYGRMNVLYDLQDDGYGSGPDQAIVLDRR